MGLPTFRRPPVVEVVLGVQFEPLPFGAFHLAQAHSLWRDAYPQVEEYAAIPSVPQGGFFIDTGSPSIRYWFINSTNTRLIQIQKDRIVLNWRAQGHTEEYPRYRELRQEIEERFADFGKFAAAQYDAHVKPIATEVSYINAIGIDKRVPLDEVLNFVSRPSILHDAPVEANIQVRFDTSDSSGLVSNLTIGANRDASRDPAPIMLQLSSHSEIGESGYTAALDASHETVVTSFRDITTPSMHASWELV